MRNLNLLGFLPEEEEESGSALEERAVVAGGEAPRREREPEAPLPLVGAATAFFLSSFVAVIDVLLEILRRLC